MRILVLAFSLVFWPAIAGAVPRMPDREPSEKAVAPRLLTGQLAEALAKAGCMPRVRGQWAFDAREHRPENWRPEPPKGVSDCVSTVLPLFPPAMTDAVLVWPFP
jgi:hypothetical protein